jgi:hypothetical protein
MMEGKTSPSHALPLPPPIQRVRERWLEAATDLINRKGGLACFPELLENARHILIQEEQRVVTVLL